MRQACFLYPYSLWAHMMVIILAIRSSIATGNCLDIAGLKPGMYIHHLALATSTLKTRLVWLSFLSEFVHGTCGSAKSMNSHHSMQLWSFMRIKARLSPNHTRPCICNPWGSRGHVRANGVDDQTAVVREESIVGVISPNSLWIKVHQVLSRQTVTRIKHSSYILLHGIPGTLQEHACKLAH